MKFIDLFAGIGGFHKALSELDHECVFASEINPELQKCYESTWKIKPHGDIRKILEENIDIILNHDILCSGFPCQPYSKAGRQKGKKDTNNGNLFDLIIKILRAKQPRYFILENVPHLAKHNDEETWKTMYRQLVRAGYKVKKKIYSPHEFGIPQHRKRIFIVGSLNGLDHFKFEEIDKHKVGSANIHDFIEKDPITTKKLPTKNILCLDLWQRFIDCIPKNVGMPGFPIWSMEFGATYPFNKTSPQKMTVKQLGKYKGNFGVNLNGLTKKQQLALLPSYARTKKKFPSWKKRWISQNREFYELHKKHIGEVVKEISKLDFQSWQKLEWNVGESEREIKKYILQFRASGVRVKKANFFPSLVCPSTQVPIIGWQLRYITKTEGLRLQSMEGVELPKNENEAFMALGNAVNVTILKLIARQLLIEEKNNQINNQILERADAII